MVPTTVLHAMIVVSIQKQLRKNRSNVLRVMLVPNLIKVAPNVNLAKQECLVMSPVPIVKIAMLANTVKAQKKTVLPLPMLPFALVARLVGRPKPVIPNVNLAKLECLVMPPVPIVKIAMLINTVKAKKTTVLPLPMLPFALIARLGGHRKPAAPSAKRASLVLSAASEVNRASLAKKVSIVKVKNRTVRVGFVHNVLQILRNASVVQQVGTRSRAALNAKRVALEHMVMGVRPVNWVTQGKAPIPTRPNVGAANLVRRRRQKDQPLVKNVMLVLMETRRDSARSVPPVTFKTAKENKRYEHHCPFGCVVWSSVWFLISYFQFFFLTPFLFYFGLSFSPTHSVQRV